MDSLPSRLACAWALPPDFAVWATASAAEAVARNPGARAGILLLLVLGLAFMESLSLFTFVIIFLKVK
jgi:hypothetical protein